MSLRSGDYAITSSLMLSLWCMNGGWLVWNIFNGDSHAMSSLEEKLVLSGSSTRGMFLDLSVGLSVLNFILLICNGILND